MTQEAINNGIVLYELGLAREQVEESLRVMKLVPELLELLKSPVIANNKKHAVIDDIYSRYDCPKKLVNFIKVMCDHNELDEIEDIYTAYYDYWDEKNNIKRVSCIFAKEADCDEMDEIREFLQEKYAGWQLIYEICIDPDILGGVIVRIGHEEYDWSYENRIRQLEQIIRGQRAF